MDSWSDLPYDVLEEIAKKLRHMELLYFGLVCKPWQFFYLENYHRLPRDLPIFLLRQPRPNRAPFLLQSCKPDSDSRKYVCVVDEKVQGEIFLPEAANKWICGSSWGWLVTMEIKGQEISLLNPFTRREIKLPSLATFPVILNGIGQPDDARKNCFHFIFRAIISTDPISNPQDCVVMTLAGNIKRLCFCKLGDSKWTRVEGSPGAIEDLTHYQDRFYAITQTGLTVSYDAKNPNDHKPEIVACGPSWIGCNYIPKRYLVPSGEDLLQVWRIYEFDFPSLKQTQTVKFEVFKLVKTESSVLHQAMKYFKTRMFTRQNRGYCECKEMKNHWSRLESVKDQLILIGFNGSFSVPSSVHKNCKGCKIYFADDYNSKHIGNLLLADRFPIAPYHDIGLYDMEHESLHSYYPNDHNELLPAIWIVPHPL